MSVTLQPSAPPPVPVGTVVTWTAAASSAAPGTLWYRFRVRQAGAGAVSYPARARLAGAPFSMLRDYGPSNSLNWAPSEHEGFYEIEVSVRNKSTAETAVSTAVYQVISRVAGAGPQITPTANPLVYLYSAPPCPVGSRMRVQFQSADGVSQSTPYKPCQSGLSMNFYLAGLRANTDYVVKHTVQTGSQSVDGPVLSLATQNVSLSIAPYSVNQAPPAPITNGVLLQSTLFQMTVATDLNGNVVWFYPGQITYVTRPEAGGRFLAVVENPLLDPSQQLLREIDLAGNTTLETNAARVSEQLAELGKRPITAFHHEARRMPNGNILTLGSTEQILADVQGAGPVDILGDMILVLDSNLQVQWAWDAFDHLDTRRMATLGETCTPRGGGCPPFYLAQQANDWLHGNSLQFTPDGNILYSSRHQDWLIKIDYDNGRGTGNVIWRLGEGGDFQIHSTDPYPWFSHQHDANFDFSNPSMLTVFDDGNVRQANDPNAHSRGQVLQLDEQTRVANLVLNVDLGGYSYALGASKRLPNGHYHFDLGYLPDGSSRSVEVDSSGNIVYDISVGTPEYRTFRMQDLYTPCRTVSQ